MIFQLPSPRRSRHPLARLLSAVLGLAMLGVLLVSGLVVAGILLVGGIAFFVWRRWFAHRVARVGPAGKPASSVLEGEFVVIHDKPAAQH